MIRLAWERTRLPPLTKWEADSAHGRFVIEREADGVSLCLGESRIGDFASVAQAGLAARAAVWARDEAGRATG